MLFARMSSSKNGIKIYLNAGLVCSHCSMGEDSVSEDMEAGSGVG